jgi:hypothetical protein
MGQERVLIAWNRVLFPDGSSLDLGSMGGIQGDAVRNVTGNIGRLMSDANPGQNMAGVFVAASVGGNGSGTSGGSGRAASMDISRQVPTAVEIRPVNMAVRYLIRAKP